MKADLLLEEGLNSVDECITGSHNCKKNQEMDNPRYKSLGESYDGDNGFVDMGFAPFCAPQLAACVFALQGRRK